MRVPRLKIKAITITKDKFNLNYFYFNKILSTEYDDIKNFTKLVLMKFDIKILNSFKFIAHF